MLPDVEVTASSTVAPELAAAGTDAQNTPVDLAALSSQQYDKWRQTGEIPEATPKPAESAPAKESAAPAGGTAPDSEPGKKSEEPEKHKGAEARKEQLAAEIQEILRERREARRELEEVRATLAREKGEKVSAAPAAAEPTNEPIFKHFLDQAETYEEAVQQFQRAHSKWAIDQHEATRQAAEKERTAAEQREAFTNRVEKDAAEIQDFEAVTGKADNLKPTPAMLAAIVESEIPGKLLYHLARNPTEFHRIAALTPAKAIRELGKIEDSLAAAQPVNGAPAPPVKTLQHSKAPPPPTDLAARNTAPEDEADAALEAKDFERYRRVQDARDIKRLRPQ